MTRGNGNEIDYKLRVEAEALEVENEREQLIARATISELEGVAREGGDEPIPPRLTLEDKKRIAAPKSTLTAVWVKDRHVK